MLRRNNRAVPNEVDTVTHFTAPNHYCAACFCITVDDFVYSKPILFYYFWCIEIYKNYSGMGINCVHIA